MSCFTIVERKGQKAALSNKGQRLINQDLLQVPAQPYSREMAPAKFSHNVISIVEEIANFHGMISTYKKKMIDEWTSKKPFAIFFV